MSELQRQAAATRGWPSAPRGIPALVLEWLERDLEERSLDPPFYAFDPVFDELRGDPRFTGLVARVRLAKLDGSG